MEGGNKLFNAFNGCKKPFLLSEIIALKCVGVVVLETSIN